MSMLEVEGLSMRFGAREVLKEASLRVEEATIGAVIGPNGAGKTVLLNCVSGIYRPDEGRISLAGDSLLGLRPDQVATRGIGRSFQHLELFGRLTVLDNLLVAASASRRVGLLESCLYWGPCRRKEEQLRHEAEQIIDFFELEGVRDKLAGGLPYGIQKVVGVARAMALKPRMLLLDEPGSGLTRDEKEHLARFLLRLRHDWGMTILWVEHDIQMVLDLADRVTALDSGRIIASGSPKDVRKDPGVIESYLGEATQPAVTT